MGASTNGMATILGSSANAAKGVLMVRLADADATVEIEGASVKPMFPANGSDMDCWRLVRFDESLSVEAMAERIAQMEGIERVEYSAYIQRPKTQRMAMPESRPEPTRSVEYPFDDPELPWQWHYHNDGGLSEDAKAGADINLLNAWKYTAGDNRVIVAVIDGGIMADHPDLEANIWVNEKEKSGLQGVDDDGNGYVDDIHGWNFVQNNGNIVADDHGTHVAGTISAVNNNGFAVCGIAGGTGKGDGVRLMSIEIFEGDEGCFTHQIAEGIRYAADNGAVIANNSWGYDPYSYANDKAFENYMGVLHEAINYFKENARLEGVLDGGIMLFAAGNETTAVSDYPGAYHSNISVTAMAADYTPAFYTNYGPGTNICAPGGDASYGTIMAISSTSMADAYGYGYEYMHGTSMATPHVSGCAALGVSYALKQGYHFTADEFRNLLLTSVHDINPYMNGTRPYFDHINGSWTTMQLAPYYGKMGTGYIDAHLLLMQLDGTPCLYVETGEQMLLELDTFFGDGAKELTYEGVEVSDEVKSALGITTQPIIEEGLLKITCSKAGIGRIKIKAIAGDKIVGGNDITGGMLIEREIEVVARGSVASNGGWL